MISTVQSHATSLRVLQIDDQSPAAELRTQRLRVKLDQMLPRPPTVEPVRTDIASTSAIKAAMQTIPDHADVIVLAGSGLMALAAMERFEKATVLYASQHDLSDPDVARVIGISNRNATGFTYDANVIPQIVSMLNRAGAPTRRIAIVADQYLAQAWRRRAAEMAQDLPNVAFVVFDIGDDAALERSLASPEGRGADVWIFLETLTFQRRFNDIRRHLEATRKIGVYPDRSYVVAGGFMSYSATIVNPFGIWARQIALIARGVPVTEIPVERPSTFDFALNLPAAKRIGLPLPPKFVKTADYVVTEPPPRP